MYVAFYKGRGTILDWIIRAATRSPYSHVEIIDRMPGVGENPIGFTSSPRDGGVVVREIPWRPENWDVVFVPWTNGEKAMTFIHEREGAGYDWLGILFTHALGIGRQSSRRWTCSELIGTALGFERAWRMTPGDLHADLSFAIRKARPIPARLLTE